MEAGKKEEIEKGIISIPTLIAKIETYFTKEKPADDPIVPAKEEKPADDPKGEDFSSVIATLEKTFTKSESFETLKTSVGTLVDQISKSNETISDLTGKFNKQEATIAEVFALVKKIAEAPSEESKFKKKEGVKTTSAGNMNKWMEEAAELSKKTFK